MNIEICDFCEHVMTWSKDYPCNECFVIYNWKPDNHFKAIEWAKEAFEKHIKEIENND